ncbi:unnamed protein product, partial [Ectocarpus sp. 13 AM-2016]
LVWRSSCWSSSVPRRVIPHQYLNTSETSLQLLLGRRCSPISRRVLKELPQEWYLEGGDTISCWAVPRFGAVMCRMRRRKTFVLTYDRQRPRAVSASLVCWTATGLVFHPQLREGGSNSK